MIRKLNNKLLFLILLALVAIYGISRYIANKKGENTFHTNIIPKIDTTRVNCMYIYPRGGKKAMRFDLKGKTWYVTQDNITARAEAGSEQYVVQQLQQITPDRLAANDPKKWNEYDVSDTAGTRVVLLNNKDTIVDVLVGRFSYQPAQRMALSAVRLHSQNEVYNVQGFLSMNITNEFSAWRDKTLLPTEFQTWTRLEYNYHDTSFTVIKSSTGGWMVDGNKPDTMAAAAIIQRLTQQDHGQFVDKFDTNAVKPIGTLTISDNTHAIVTIKAYPADSANGYVITSTMNPGAYISGAKNKGDIFHNIFVSRKTFFIRPEAPKAQPNSVPRKR